MQSFTSEKEDVFWSMDTSNTISIPFIQFHRYMNGIMQFHKKRQLFLCGQTKVRSKECEIKQYYYQNMHRYLHIQG